MSKLVNCKSCGAQIAKSAKICPKCGAKQKKPVWLIAGIIIVVLAVISVISGTESPEKVGTLDSSPENTTPILETDADVFSIGDIVELDGVNVTLLGVHESTGTDIFRPTDGNVFVTFEFDISNQSDSEIAVSSLLSFSAYFDDYAATLDISAVSNAAGDGYAQLDGSIPVGKKMTGIVGYQAPNDWSSAEIRFTPDFWGGKEIIFQYEK